MLRWAVSLFHHTEVSRPFAWHGKQPLCLQQSWFDGNSQNLFDWLWKLGKAENLEFDLSKTSTVEGWPFLLSRDLWCWRTQCSECSKIWPSLTMLMAESSRPSSTNPHPEERRTTYRKGQLIVFISMLLIYDGLFMEFMLKYWYMFALMLI
jgi:hypothetical protein